MLEGNVEIDLDENLRFVLNVVNKFLLLVLVDGILPPSAYVAYYSSNFI